MADILSSYQLLSSLLGACDVPSSKQGRLTAMALVSPSPQFLDPLEAPLIFLCLILQRITDCQP